MSSLLPSVTFSPLVSGFTSIDQKTITLWFQLNIGAGVYETGGIPMGLQTLAGSLTVVDTDFLQAIIFSERQVPATGTFYEYQYVPAFDYLQIFSVAVTAGAQSAPAELASSSVIPALVLSDTIIGQAIYNRLPTV